MSKNSKSVNDSELGKKSEYQLEYNPNILFAIERSEKRQEIGINPNHLPFKGYDYWNHYEVSWLNHKGKPISAIAEIYYDSSSSHIIESKSFKLYFNSFNNSKFDGYKQLENIIKSDVSSRINSNVGVKITELARILDNHNYNSSCNLEINNNLAGILLDNLDIECNQYNVNPELLSTNNAYIEEVLYSNLLKSNCLVTNQPDWGSVQISYKGNAIDKEGLLKYIISFRNHNEFHEQCIERIFIDILNYCEPDELTVFGRYTRRGGLDINPYRTNKPGKINYINTRLIRQ